MTEERRWLVTGAGGFVGACLARRLVKEGAEVHVLTRPSSSNRWRITDLLPFVREHPVSVLDEPGVRAVFRAVRPHVVANCATVGGYPFQQDAGEIVRVNVLGTLNVLRAALDTGFDCFIQMGSSSEYGHKDAPMRETDSLEPVGAYAAAKGGATLLCQGLARACEVNVAVIRLFSVYGPYEEPTRLIPSMIRSCLEGRDPEVTRGEQVRDFVFTDDVVDLCMAVSRSPRVAGEILNAGTGVQHSVRHVVERIVALSGAVVRPRWGALPTRAFETTRWVADPSKSARLLGWRPATSLDEGLARTIAWQRAHHPSEEVSTR